MKCTACRARLGAYHDGDLSRADQLLIAGHLARCGSCTAFSQRLHALEAVLERLPDAEPAADFTARAMASIAGLPAPRLRTARVWWIAAYVAVAWAVLGMAAALHALGWQPVAASTGLLLAHAGIALDALYRIGRHFHVTTLAAIAVAAEFVVAAAVGVLARKYIARISRTLSGAHLH